MTVFAGVRNAEDGHGLEEESGGLVTTLVLDIAQDASIARAAETVRAAVGSEGLFALVNNASGGGRQSPMEYVTREALEGVFGVTAFGTLLTTRALLPMIRQARGRVVNVGAGRLPLPLLGPGFGAKFAMEGMTDVLRVELREVGVRVSIVEPGMTRWEDEARQLAVYARELDAAIERVPPEDRARYEKKAESFKAVNRRMMATAAPADRVARTIERALSARRPRARYYCGWEQKTSAWLERLTTERTRDAVVRRVLGL
jgi:NAD(P)-dependent dehydrogenase (short-subunit alcohol dehydrogenase family)